MESWIAELSCLEKVRLPRCYTVRMLGEPQRYELHVFCDASEAAFGAVAYVRMVTQPQKNDHQDASCSFVLSKIRLAPLKQLTIVRLELQAAVLAVRKAATIKQEMTYSFSSTPRHFLLGYPEAGLPPGMFSDSELLSKRRWRHSQVFSDHIWKRWKKEYLPQLNRREKWTVGTPNIEEDDVVLMTDDTALHGYWPLARVTKAFPSGDGRVRSVEVKTVSGSIYRRPVNKVCILERCP